MVMQHKTFFHISVQFIFVLTSLLKLLLLYLQFIFFYNRPWQIVLLLLL